jgi:hypothetical protein
MAAGTSQLFSADAVLPSVPPGNYHVLVRVDALNQVPDPQASNDLAASAGTIAIGVPSLVLNAPPLSVDLASGDERLFELETPAFETVKITLEHESDAAWTELFVRFEAVPSPGLFDFRFDSVGQPRQVVVLPETREGKYYVLARAVRGAFSPGGQKAEVSARTVPFSVDAVSPRSIGDAGRATLTVRGSQFVEQGGVFLENLSGSRKAARHVERIDASLLRATFDLDGVSRGRNTVGRDAARAGGPSRRRGRRGERRTAAPRDCRPGPSRAPRRRIGRHARAQSRESRQRRRRIRVPRRARRCFLRRRGPPGCGHPAPIPR